MFIFIFESIGTSELILIGIIALIFLGPRKLPQMARTIGKTMADFRSTTNEFRSTWEREVNFDEEKKALETGEVQDKPVAVPRVNSISTETEPSTSAPEVREIDKASFDDLVNQSRENVNTDEEGETEETDESSDKRNWL